MNKQMIEELTNKICSILFIKSSQPNCDDCYFNDGCEYKVLAEELLKDYQPKIPEGAVIVSKQVWDEHIENWDKTTRAVEERVRKETAEKFARGFINDILPKIMNGHNEKALQIAMAMTNYYKEITEGEK